MRLVTQMTLEVQVILFQNGKPSIDTKMYLVFYRKVLSLRIFFSFFYTSFKVKRLNWVRTKGYWRCEYIYMRSDDDYDQM